MIPFNKPFVGQNGTEGISRALNSGHLSGDGPETIKASKLIAGLTNSPHVLLTPSCTHALELAVRLLGLEKEDEVIVPSFTFTSTANCIVLAGATPVFVDVDRDTLNISLEHIEAAVTDKTKAIILVHYAGIAVDIDPIQEFAISKSIVLIEDNAHGFGGFYKGKPLGSFGVMSTLSFHETKNIQCGEGGALCINDSKYLENAEIFREKGTNRSRFFRGQVDKYTWVGEGSSLLLSDILAGLLVGQLEEFEQIQAKRKFIWNKYFTELQSWSLAKGVRLPVLPDFSEHPAHIFYMICPTLEFRTQFISYCRSKNVALTFHYQALHESAAGKEFGRHTGALSITSAASDRLVRLPVWPDMSVDEIETVIAVIKNFEGSFE